jgi:hypothetical protein
MALRGALGDASAFHYGAEQPQRHEIHSRRIDEVFHGVRVSMSFAKCEGYIPRRQFLPSAFQL